MDCFIDKRTTDFLFGTRDNLFLDVKGIINITAWQRIECLTGSDLGNGTEDLQEQIKFLLAPINNTEQIVSIKYLVLIQSALSFERSAAVCVIPDSFSALYNSYFNSLCNRAINSDRVISQGDTFQKDLSICTGEVILAGARILSAGGFARSLILKGGTTQFLSLLRLLLSSRFNNRGLEMHVHLGYLDEFNADGWRTTLNNCQQLLIENNKLEFIFACSWLYDPALYEISPHLKYHLDEALRSGAVHVCWGESDPGCGALSKSRKRKRLYEEGVYSPKSYCIILQRKKIKAID